MMKLHRLLIHLLIASSFLMITACGGGVGGPIGYSEVIVHMTNTKPLFPKGADQATNLWVTITGVSVLKSEGGWISLPLAEDPHYTIDLLQFIDGTTAEIVPPVVVEYGKYTQARLTIEGATIRFNDNPATDSQVTIPPEHLKTNINFNIDVDEPEAIDVIVNFDLSQSLVVTDTSGTPEYKLNPVLHIVRASEATTINGNIDSGSFIIGHDAKVTVYVPNSNFPGAYEEYTQIEVSESGTDPTTFSIYWLVPDQTYSVEIDFDPNFDNGYEFSEDVSDNDLKPGEVWNLNMSIPI
jgi:hypothetical protein